MLKTAGSTALTPQALAEEFTAMYRREFPYVWHTLRRLGVPTRDVPDVTHDVFMAVFRRFDTFDKSRPLRPWLFGVAFRVAGNHLRLSRNANELIADAIEVADSAPGADERLVDRQNQEIVNEGLMALDLDRRAVLIMHDIDGHPAPEISAALAVPLKTVYSRLRLAREDFVSAVRRVRARRGDR
jgi:RNA polymerase sigma-70 factor (ECF subfamily)